MVIVFTFVVAGTLLFTAFWVAFIEIRNPEHDTEGTVDVLFSSITVILGALLGLLAGKSDTMSDLGSRPDLTKRP